MGKLCAITGLVLTLVGTVLAGRALRQDWRAHSGGAPLIPALGRMRRWIVWHILRRRPEVHSVTGQMNATFGAATVSASGYVAPPSNAPVDVQMRFVRERLLALEATIADERRQINQRIDRVQTAAQEADARSQAAITEVETKVREVATGSVRMELVGLVLVGFGSIVSTLPAVFGWQ